MYLSTVGSPAVSFGANVPGGLNESNTFVKLNEEAPEDIVDSWRNELEGREGRTVNIMEVNSGPPSAGLEVTITGNDYQHVSSVAALELMDKLAALWMALPT